MKIFRTGFIIITCTVQYWKAYIDTDKVPVSAFVVFS